MAFFQAKHLWVSQLADGVAALVLDRHNSPVNFLDPAMLAELVRAIDAIRDAARYRLLIIRSGKPGSFCQGRPASLIASWKKEEHIAWAEQGQKLCTKLSEMPMASVAIIAGSCVDAGLELALACDYRVVVNKPATGLGFDEPEWGLVPCWGATQRLPHLIGLEKSFHLLLASNYLDAKEAWMQGVADAVVENVDDPPPDFLENPTKRDWTTFPHRTWRQSYLESHRLGRWFLFRGTERILRTSQPDEFPAHQEILAALRVAYQHSTLQAGLDFERQALSRVVEHPALHHMLRMLTHREKLISAAPPPTKKPIHHLAIIGTDQSALSLLLHAVNKGYEVVLRGRDDAALGAALAEIFQVLQSEVYRGTLTSIQCQKTLSAIRGTYTWTHFNKVDLVIDMADGSLADRQAFYQEMEKQLPRTAVIASSTLTHRVEELRGSLKYPDRLVGVHIIEPWQRGAVAEIVVPPFASVAAGKQLRDWAASLEQCCLDVPDKLGGLVMRIWLPALNEAGLMIREGVAIDRIDAAMRRFGMRQGPLEWMDQLGLDRVVPVMSACAPLFSGRIGFESGFSLMTENRWLGNRTAIGFYRPGFRRLRPNWEAVAMWKSQSQGELPHPVPVLSEAHSHAWIQKRLVMLTVLEAARCLEEGTVRNPDDLDCAMCVTCWATHRGGPIGYARQLGHDAVAAICTELAQQYGPRYALLPALKEILRN